MIYFTDENLLGLRPPTRHRRRTYTKYSRLRMPKEGRHRKITVGQPGARRSSEGPGTLQCSHQSPRYVGKGAACLDALDIFTLEELVSAGIGRPKTPEKAPLVGPDEGYEDVWTNTQPMRSARARERIRRRVRPGGGLRGSLVDPQLKLWPATAHIEACGKLEAKPCGFHVGSTLPLKLIYVKLPRDLHAWVQGRKQTFQL